MERRGVVEKSRGLQGGRTDERITPELSPVVPWIRGSVETKSSRLAGRKAGRSGPGLGPRPGLGLPRSVSSQGGRPAGSGMGVGGWEIGMSELAGGRRLDAGSWRGLLSLVRCG